jgi:hypothetical protein
MAMITTSYGANVSKKNVKGELVDKVEEGVGFFFLPEHWTPCLARPQSIFEQ